MLACHIDKRSVVLVSYINRKQTGVISEEKMPHFRLVSKQVCGAFPFLTVHVGGPSPLWIVLSVGRLSKETS